eukprot:TRINITY_DN9085_c0_g1_i1.p1 TRINITY_DN9085_c0_g1~~TRINITY_DN9085_c0_g1_i1.p1  ORF type:complete len:512 (-),score=52.74 TRINITY_DN9085_c0_g1_i1:63-1598(-)
MKLHGRSSIISAGCRCQWPRDPHRVALQWVGCRGRCHRERVPTGMDGTSYRSLSSIVHCGGVPLRGLSSSRDHGRTSRGVHVAGRCIHTHADASQHAMNAAAAYEWRKLGKIFPQNSDEYVGDMLPRLFPFRTKEKWEVELCAGRVKQVPSDVSSLPPSSSSSSPPPSPSPSPVSSVPSSPHKPSWGVDINTRVRRGSRLWITVPFPPGHDKREQELIEQISVLRDDGDTVVIGKPAHIPAHPAGRRQHHSLVALLKRMSGLDGAIPVHRIDTETSGIVVCVRNKATRNTVQTLFSQGKIKKMYLAFARCVEADRPPREGSVLHATQPIGRAVGSRIRIKRWFNSPNARAASTHFRVVKTDGMVALLACFPEHGRTHQIRVHLRSLGMSLLGDKLYHPNENVFLNYDAQTRSEWVREQVGGVGRHLLHHAAIQGPKGSPLETAIVMEGFPLDGSNNAGMRDIDGDQALARMMEGVCVSELFHAHYRDHGDGGGGGEGGSVPARSWWQWPWW